MPTHWLVFSNARADPPVLGCEGAWLPAQEDRWQALLTDDEPAELVFYCPECAEREFGPD